MLNIKLIVDLSRSNVSLLSKMVLLIAISMANLGCSWSLLIAANKYDKVPNTFLSKFGNNNLGLISVQGTIYSCLNLCSANPDCTLACFNSSLCQLSSAIVTPYWIPVASSSQPLLPLPGYKCFSSWTFENDITTKIVSTAASSVLSSSEYSISYAVDGYFVDTSNTHFMASSNNNSWYRIDMGIAYSICKVVVKQPQSYDYYFAKVEVRVGNSSDTGNFQSNALLGYFNGTATQGKVVTFGQGTQIVGRYISLQQLATDYFLIGELKVIGC